MLIEIGIPMKLVRLIKMCLNEMNSRSLVGKHLSDVFPVRNGLKLGDALTLLIFGCLRVCHLECSRKPGWLVIKWYTSAFGFC